MIEEEVNEKKEIREGMPRRNSSLNSSINKQNV